MDTGETSNEHHGAPDSESYSDDTSDFLLASFVRNAEIAGGSFPITLWTSGGIVSGTLVGFAAYADGLADELRSAPGDAAAAESGSRLFEDWATTARANMAGIPEERRQLINVTHLHLLDVRIFAAGREHLLRAWRGSLSSVAGWTFGTLGPHEQHG